MALSLIFLTVATVICFLAAESIPGSIQYQASQELKDIESALIFAFIVSVIFDFSLLIIMILSFFIGGIYPEHHISNFKEIIDLKTNGENVNEDSLNKSVSDPTHLRLLQAEANKTKDHKDVSFGFLVGIVLSFFSALTLTIICIYEYTRLSPFTKTKDSSLKTAYDYCMISFILGSLSIVALIISFVLLILIRQERDHDILTIHRIKDSKEKKIGTQMPISSSSLSLSSSSSSSMIMV